MAKKLLFQGDSICDSGRDVNVTEPNTGLGGGYVSMLAASLVCGDPEIKVYNRGVSGNRILDMYARWEEDAMCLDFDILTVMNGINDVGFGIRHGTGASREKYRRIYSMLLTETLERRPNTALVLCQPFVLDVDHDWPPYGNDIHADYQAWRDEIVARGEIVRELADEFGAVFLPLREVMEAAVTRAPAVTFSPDGIHPSLFGHRLIADAWLEKAGHLLK